MTSYFDLILDTTPPGSPTFVISADAPYATSQSVTGDFTTSDTDTTGYQIKIWGDVDPSADTNIKTTEVASSWIAYSASQAFSLSNGDGVKTINAKIRDDVGNETAVLTDTITLNTTAPVIDITVAASPTKISKIATFDTSTLMFQSSTDLQAWVVMVVPASGSGHGTGTSIPTTAGSTNVAGGALAAGTGQSVTIKGADLETASPGDGDKIVKVFGQDLAGLWSV